MVSDARPSAHETDPAESRYRSQSLWLAGVDSSLRPRPTLPGDAHFDVAIVGAGFTGLWTAYYLVREQPSLRVAVIEREIAGFGASGRNGGWASAGIAGKSTAYRHRPNDDVMRRANRETQLAIDEIGHVAATERIDCGFLKAGALTVATTQPQRQRLRALVESAAYGGGERELHADELQEHVKIAGAVGSVLAPHAARVDPARLTRGLADACERHGATIFEHTEALEINPKRVVCRTGTVRADAVLRTTEAYTTQFHGEQRRYLPLYSLMIATEVLPDAVWDEIGWTDGLLIEDLRHLFFYAQRTRDGRIAIGGRGAPYRLGDPLAGRNERSPTVFNRLRTTLKTHFPAAGEASVTHHWGGPLAVPRDWSMSVSFDHRSGFGFAGGYSGHGVVAANIAGRTLADLVLDHRTDRLTLPWVQHHSRKWEPEPLRFLASQAIVRVLDSADRIEDSTGRSARRLRLVARFLPRE